MSSKAFRVGIKGTMRKMKKLLDVLYNVGTEDE
jgi:hypothetical protein